MSQGKDVHGNAAEWQSGWRPLVAAFMGLATGWNAAGIISGLFLKPMQAEFGWSRTELSYGPLVGLLVALLLPSASKIVDRFGARTVGIAGITMLASAHALLASIPVNRAAYYLTLCWFALSATACASVVFARGVTAWFDRNLGTAIGIMMTGASVAVAVGVPILSGIIEHRGWRDGLYAVAGFIAVAGLPPLIAWFRKPPGEQTAARSRREHVQTGREIARHAAFAWLVAGSAVAALPIGGFIGHLVPLLSDQGLAAASAARLASILSVAVAIGRIGNGYLLDRCHPPAVTCGTLLLAALGTSAIAGLALSSTSLAVIALCVGLIGLAQGAEGDYIKFFSMRLFGLANFSRVVALLATTISLGMAAGGLLFARVFDHYGTYRPAVLGSIVLYALGGLLFLRIPMGSRRTRE